MQMREMMFPLKKQFSLLCFVWQFNLFTGTNFYPKFCPLSCLHNITITQYHNNTISNWETLQNIQNSNPTTGSVRPRYCERKLTPFFLAKLAAATFCLSSIFISVFIWWQHQWTNFSVSCFSLIVQSSTGGYKIQMIEISSPLSNQTLQPDQISSSSCICRHLVKIFVLKAEASV